MIAFLRSLWSRPQAAQPSTEAASAAIRNEFEMLRLFSQAEAIETRDRVKAQMIAQLEGMPSTPERELTLHVLRFGKTPEGKVIPLMNEVGSVWNITERHLRDNPERGANILVAALTKVKS